MHCNDVTKRKHHSSLEETTCHDHRHGTPREALKERYGVDTGQTGFAILMVMMVQKQKQHCTKRDKTYMAGVALSNVMILPHEP